MQPVKKTEDFCFIKTEDDKDIKTTCSEKQVLKMLKQIFEVWNTNKNKNWYLDLISLKLKH